MQGIFYQILRRGVV